MQTAAMKLRQYQEDFLRANKCTADEFEQDYLAFMATKPDTRAYRLFARKYQIQIHHEPSLPEHLRLVLCISMAVIKVLSRDHIEAQREIEDMMRGINPTH